VNGGPATFQFSVALPNNTILSEDIIKKYERAVALALGLDFFQVIATTDRIFGAAQTARRLLSAASGGLEITFVIVLSGGFNAVAVAAQIETNTFKDNLAVALAGEGLVQVLVREESLVGGNFDVNPPPPSPPPPPAGPSPPPGGPSPPGQDSTGSAGKARGLARCALLLCVMTVWILY